MDDGHATLSGGVQVDMVERIAAHSNEAQVRGGVKDLRKDEVCFHNKDVEPFVPEPRAQLIRILETATLKPTLVHHIHART
jgi:hypothetical protein